MDVPVKLGDSSSNGSRDIGLRLPHFVTNDDDEDAGVYAGHDIRAKGLKFAITA